MADIKIYKIMVTGFGPFPVQMLRHGCCWPFAFDDAPKLNWWKKRTVVLLSNKRPNEARWKSFGWRCEWEEVRWA